MNWGNTLNLVTLIVPIGLHLFVIHKNAQWTRRNREWSEINRLESLRLEKLTGYMIEEHDRIQRLIERAVNAGNH